MAMTKKVVHKKKILDRPRKPRNTARYQIAEGTIIDYKNVELLKKFINDRGRIVARRVTGVTAKEQRLIATAVKRARFLGLLNVGAVR